MFLLLRKCRSNPLTPNVLKQLVENAAEAAAAGDDGENKIENLLAKEFHVRYKILLCALIPCSKNTAVHTNELSKAGRSPKGMCRQGQICQCQA